MPGADGREPQGMACTNEDQAEEVSPRHRIERLREDIRKLVLMKETGPKSATWHRARVRTIWRLQRQLDALDPPRPNLLEKQG